MNSLRQSPCVIHGELQHDEMCTILNLGPRGCSELPTGSRRFGAACHPRARGGADSLGIGGSSLRAHSAMLLWEAPGHAELVGANNTDEWKPPQVVDDADSDGE